MAVNKKISELPVVPGIGANDVSVLVNNGIDYQFSISLLLQYITANVSSGASFSFGTVLPQNNTGKNGDVFIKTTTGQFVQKIAGTWSVVYSIPISAVAGPTLLYGEGVPASSTGENGNSFIDTLTGIFYQKQSGSWSQVFSMQTGPQGPRGLKGDQGIAGAAGTTILSGASNPSNAAGSNGDFYINTNTFRIFGPKTAGIWGTGLGMIQSASDVRYQPNTTTPTLSNWQLSDAVLYGNFPRVRLLIEDADGNEVEAQGILPKYSVDRTDPLNPLVTQISWDLPQLCNCRILIN